MVKNSDNSKNQYKNQKLLNKQIIIHEPITHKFKRSMQVDMILTSVAFMGGLGLILASMLVIANRRLAVVEDPMLDSIEDLLPHANCGACGFPGCRPFAEGLLAKTNTPGQCTVNSEDLNQEIADLLGVDVGNVEKRVARLACAGGSHVAKNLARYAGMKSCRASVLVSGGVKSCAWVCLVMADCVVSCDFDAISMNKFGLPQVNATL